MPPRSPPASPRRRSASGLTNPTAVRFAAGRPRLRRREERPDQGLRQPVGHDADGLRRPAHERPQLLGPRPARAGARPELPDRRPYVYVLYTLRRRDRRRRAALGHARRLSDPCPTPPGPTADGCVVSGRLSRLQASGNVMTGPEQVLIEDWCQQYPSHSIGTLAFGADGALYVDAAATARASTSPTTARTGTRSTPAAIRPVRSGGALTPPTAEGGALRSQDLRTTRRPDRRWTARSSASNPDTGAGMPDNPLAAQLRRRTRAGSSPTASATRSASRSGPGTNELWVGDVGWNTWEEINRIADPTDAVVDNFGWPCYEGAGRQPGYDGANLNICENLYAAARARSPRRTSVQPRGQGRPRRERAPTGSSSISGHGVLRRAAPIPAAYDGALFFADYSRNCIWVMPPGSNGLPDSGRTIRRSSPSAAGPVDLADRARRRPLLRRLRRRHDPRISFSVGRRGQGAEPARLGVERGEGRAGGAEGQRRQRPRPAGAPPSPTTSGGRSTSAGPPGQHRQLNWEAAYASSYRLLTSLDGVDFSLAADADADRPQPPDHQLQRPQRPLPPRPLPHPRHPLRLQLLGRPRLRAHRRHPRRHHPADGRARRPQRRAPPSRPRQCQRHRRRQRRRRQRPVQARRRQPRRRGDQRSLHAPVWNTATDAPTARTRSPPSPATPAATQRPATTVPVTVATAVAEDKALGQPAAASSVEKAGLEAPKGNDGYVRHPLEPPPSPTVSGGRSTSASARQVDSVASINWETAYASQLPAPDQPRRHQLHHRRRRRRITAPGLRDQHASRARSARYVRVLCLTRATGYGCSFWDARVYGPATALRRTRLRRPPSTPRPGCSIGA